MVTNVRTVGSARSRLRAPAIDGFQRVGEWEADAQLTLAAKGSGSDEGRLLVVTSGSALAAGTRATAPPGVRDDVTQRTTVMLSTLLTT